MIYRIVALFLLLTFFRFTQAQINVEWANIQEKQNGLNFEKILGSSGNNLVMVSAAKGLLAGETEFTINAYRLSPFEKISEKPFKIPQLNNRETTFLDVFLITDHVVVFHSRYEKDKNRNFLYASVFSIHGNTIRNLALVDSIEVFSNQRRGNFLFANSPNNHALLIMPVEPFEKTARQVLRYRILDRNLKSVSVFNTDLPYKSREFEITQIGVNNHNQVFTLAKITNLFKRWQQGEPNFKYLLLQTNNLNKEIKEFEIQLGQKSISDIVFNFDSLHLNIVGLYSETAKTIEESSGFFFIKTNINTKQIEYSLLKDYPTALLDNFLNENQVKKGKELKEFVIRRLLTNADSTYTLVLEQYIYRLVCNTDVRTGIISCQDNYYYNHVLLINFNTKGQISQHSNLPKLQFSSNENSPLNSFICLQGIQGKYLLYNDNHKNLRNNFTGKIKVYDRTRKSVVILARVSQNGLIKYQEFLHDDFKQLNFVPQKTYWLNPTTQIVYAENKKYFRLGILSITNE